MGARTVLGFFELHEGTSFAGSSRCTSPVLSVAVCAYSIFIHFFQFLNTASSRSSVFCHRLFQAFTDRADAVLSSEFRS